MAVTWNGMIVPDVFWNALDKALIANVNPRGAYPAALAVSVAFHENGWQLGQSRVPRSGPGSFNGREDSWGPFQLYRGGGLGDGYSREYLNDYDNNCRIAVNTMASRWLLSGDLYDSIQPWSVRDAAWADYQAHKFVSRSDSVPSPVPGANGGSPGAGNPGGAPASGGETPGSAPGATTGAVKGPGEDTPIVGPLLAGIHDVGQSAGILAARLAVGAAGLALFLFGAYLVFNQAKKTAIKAVI